MEALIQLVHHHTYKHKHTGDSPFVDTSVERDATFAEYFTIQNDKKI